MYESLAVWLKRDTQGLDVSSLAGTISSLISEVQWILGKFGLGRINRLEPSLIKELEEPSKWDKPRRATASQSFFWTQPLKDAAPEFRHSLYLLPPVSETSWLLCICPQIYLTCCNLSLCLALQSLLKPVWWRLHTKTLHRQQLVATWWSWLWQCVCRPFLWFPHYFLAPRGGWGEDSEGVTMWWHYMIYI